MEMKSCYFQSVVLSTGCDFQTKLVDFIQVSSSEIFDGPSGTGTVFPEHCGPLYPQTNLLSTGPL